MREQERKQGSLELEQKEAHQGSSPSSPASTAAAQDNVQEAPQSTAPFPTSEQSSSSESEINSRYHQDFLAMSADNVNQGSSAQHAKDGQFDLANHNIGMHSSFSQLYPGFQNDDHVEFPASMASTAMAFDSHDGLPGFTDYLGSDMGITSDPSTERQFSLEMDTIPLALDLSEDTRMQTRSNSEEYSVDTPRGPSSVSSDDAIASTLKLAPAPSNLASRRSRSKPLSLTAAALQGTTRMGPATVCNMERMNYPLGSPRSPMRRTASNIGNCGRIQKSYANSSQMSPRNVQALLDMEPSDFPSAQLPRSHSIPLMKAAPPTPTSATASYPQQPQRSVSASETARENNLAPFHSNPEWENVDSPPVTPQMFGMPMSYPSTYQPYQGWQYEAQDEAMFTPGGFAPYSSNLNIPETYYASSTSSSQPATPAYTPFNLPNCGSNSPLAMCSNAPDSLEYQFPEHYGGYYMSGKSSPAQPKPKNYVFSVTTAAEFKNGK